jgi:hypothetical protein
MPSGPPFQYFATVCLSSPYLLARSEKFGLAPDSLSISISPTKFLSIPAGLRILPAVDSCGTDSR